MDYTRRVVLLIDMDCFYCQVEENLDPTIKGEPIAVVQYNEWRGGGIIAVNYPARDKGVTRHMRGADAKDICPEIKLVKVPQVRGKADLSKDAGKRVADVLQTFTINLERASVDEAYLDITEEVEKRLNDKTKITTDKLSNTYVVGCGTGDFVINVNNSRDYNESNLKLAMGGVIAEEIRAQVYEITGYRCSAGIAHNKILAKLVCGLHKPNKQTILPHEAVQDFYEKLPIRKIKSLGGKFGIAVAEKLGIEYMGELVKFTQKELAKKFDEKSACWLYNIARGIDEEPVTTRLVSKSIGCCKRFPGKSTLSAREDVEHWLGELAGEISERLEKDLEENNRKAKQMVVSFAQETNGEEISSTRTHPLSSYEQSKIVEAAMKVIQKNCMKRDGTYMVTFLGISAGNFQDVSNVKEITSFFKQMRENSKKGEDNDTSRSMSECVRTSESPKLHSFFNKMREKLNEKNQSDCDNDKSTIGESSGTSGNPKLHPFFTKNVNEDEPLRPTETPRSASVYSDTTEEDDVDIKDLIFYEQVNPGSIADQRFLDERAEEEPASDSSEDSISQEFNGEERNVPIENTQVADKPKSFFAKFFEEKQRNFDTSKNLENGSTEKSNMDNNVDSLQLEESDNDKVADLETLADVVSKETRTSPAESGKCHECGKSINYLEYQLHMDYHFAINMVKKEAHLYKTEKRPSTSPIKTKPNKIGEKKKKDSCKSKPIVEYFKDRGGVALGDSQECSECNKRVRLEEWDVHVDFHAAKRLHLEINSNPVKFPSVVEPAKIKGQKNILGFLKRT